MFEVVLEPQVQEDVNYVGKYMLLLLWTLAFTPRVVNSTKVVHEWDIEPAALNGFDNWYQEYLILLILPY